MEIIVKIPWQLSLQSWFLYQFSTISYKGEIKNYQTETDDFSHLQTCLSNTAPHKCVHPIPDLCLIAIQVCSVLLLSDLYFEKNTSEIAMKNK